MFDHSPSERDFIQQGLALGLRSDGRSSTQRRKTELKSNILDNLSGSSYLSLSHGRIQIYTGVKTRIAESSQGLKQDSEVILELSSMRKLTNQMSHCLTYLQQLLQEHFIRKEMKQFRQLQIENSQKHYLQIHIESFLLAEPHLSLLEPLYLSIRKALESTTLPKLQCFYNEVTKEETVEMGQETMTPELSSVDHLLLVGCLNSRYILDLTPLEFDTVDSVVLVTIKECQATSVETVKGSLGPQQIHKIVRFVLNALK